MMQRSPLSWLQRMSGKWTQGERQGREGTRFSCLHRTCQIHTRFALESRVVARGPLPCLTLACIRPTCRDQGGFLWLHRDLPLGFPHLLLALLQHELRTTGLSVGSLPSPKRTAPVSDEHMHSNSASKQSFVFLIVFHTKHMFVA